MSKLTPPVFESRLDDTISKTASAFGTPAPPASLSALRWLAHEVHRCCTKPYLPTALCFDANNADGGGKWHFAQRVNIGAKSMVGLVVTSHALGSTAAPSQPAMTCSSDNSGVDIYAEVAVESGAHAWPISSKWVPTSTGEAYDDAATAAGLRPLLLYVEDYTEAAVADALLPYVEGFSAKNIVAFSGRYRPVADMTTLAP